MSTFHVTIINLKLGVSFAQKQSLRRGNNINFHGFEAKTILGFLPHNVGEGSHVHDDLHGSPRPSSFRNPPLAPLRGMTADDITL